MQDKKNIICIIQARMSSTRLPNKVMLSLSDKPVIFHVFNQLSFCKHIDKFVLATSTEMTDDILELWANKNNINVFRGDIDNVLERYYLSAKKYGADVIVRVTADCPLINPNVVDKVIETFLGDNYDYVCNNNPPTYPEGLDVEVFSYKALEKAYKSAEKKSDKEHVTPFIINNPDLFKPYSISNNENLGKFRLTLDRYEDYILLYEIFSNLYREGGFIDLNYVISYLTTNNKLIDINKHIVRDEGYLKSLAND